MTFLLEVNMSIGWKAPAMSYAQVQLSYADTCKELAGIELSCFKNPQRTVPVGQIASLLQGIPDWMAKAFLPRTPNGLDYVSVKDFRAGTYDSMLLQLKDVYLAHFWSYLKSLPEYESRALLSQMMLAWAPSCVAQELGALLVQQSPFDKAPQLVPS